MTATPRALVRQVTERDGRACAMCGHGGESLVPHHRANRGMGGRKSAHHISNLVWLHADENGLIESDPVLAQRARDTGLKISRHSDPASEPIYHAVFGCWVLLLPDGTAEGVAPPT